MNAIHVAYAIVFVRVALWWRRNGIGANLAARYPAWRCLADWHAVPVALYFMLPKRFGYFLWFVSPANSDHARAGGVFEGVRYYLQGLADDYNAVPWLTPVALLGVLIALVFVRRMRTGRWRFLLFLFLIALATCKHPMLKYRHAFPWVAVLWVVAAAGCIHLLCVAFRNERLRSLLATAAYAGLAIAVSPYLLSAGRSQECGLRPDLPCVLDITDAYLPELADARRPTILSNVYTPFLLSWTYQECHRKQDASFAIKSLDPANPDPQVLTRWAETTKSSVIVLIDIDPGSPFWNELPNNLDVAACRRCFEAYPERFSLTPRMDAAAEGADFDVDHFKPRMSPGAPGTNPGGLRAPTSIGWKERHSVRQPGQPEASGVQRPHRRVSRAVQSGAEPDPRTDQT